MNTAAARRLRALRRLSVAGAALLATDAEAAGYGVFPAADRRRRPLARLEADDVAALLAEGAIATRPEGAGYALTQEGEARLARSAAGEDGFRAQHQLRAAREVASQDGTRRRVTVDLAESPLAWLRRRSGADGAPFLSDRAFVAGEKLREDHYRAGLAPRVTMDWHAPPIGRAPRNPAADGPGEGAMAAKRRCLRALDALGRDLDRVVSGVCLEGLSLEAVERRSGWPKRAGKVVLRIALERLADHYGLAPAPETPVPKTPAS